MKYLFASPAIPRFAWEQEIILSNLESLGVSGDDIFILYTKYDDSIPKKLKNKYHIHTYVYPERQDQSYIPSVRPYLIWQFLKNNPQYQKETFFYADSDIIFRKLPDFSKINYDEQHWVGSDCDSYLNPNYINSKGDHLLKNSCDVVGVDYDWVSKLNGKCFGAQWIFCHAPAEYWEELYKKCSKLYKYYCDIEPKYRKEHEKTDPHYEPVQKWVSEMLVQLWLLHKYNISPSISHELDFAWSTDPLSRFDKDCIILHNAGVIDDKQGLFFKGKYTSSSPFDDLNNLLKTVDKTKCSYRYVEAMKKVKQN